MIDLDPVSLSNAERYKLLIGSVVPRPIAWVSTISPEGVANLAPFSFFTAICSSPMMLCFCPAIRSSDGKRKDTLNNIEATRECVINIVTEELGEVMNKTAAELPPDVSEFEAAGVTPVASVKVKPPRVKESPIQFEAKLHQVVTIGETAGSGSLVIVEVVQLHYAPEVYDNGKVLIRNLKPIARLAGTSYARVNDIFDMERPG